MAYTNGSQTSAVPKGGGGGGVVFAAAPFDYVESRRGLVWTKGGPCLARGRTHFP